MERPFVVCHMLTSLDGKIDGTFFGVPETVPAIKAYGELPRRTKQDLTAVMVDVPVVPATGLKGHVGNRHAHITQGAQITGPAEILPGHRVGTALREQIVKFLIHIIRPLISTCRHR